MSLDIRVPDLPESITDATVVALHKQAGDQIRRDESILDLETDKVVLEVPAPQAGQLTRYASEVGDVVKPGDLLAVIDEQATGTATEHEEITTAAAQKASPNLPTLSPAASKLAREHDIDTGQVAGTGKNGRITKQDIAHYIDAATQPPADEPVPPGAAAPASSPATGTVGSDARTSRREPMSRLRQRIAQRLVQVQHEAAILTTFNEVNLQAVMDTRSRLRDEFEKRYGVRLGFMSFFIKASVQALKQYPVINASVEDSDIIFHDFYDIGIAVSSPRGLVVPVLRDADKAGFGELETRIIEYAERARNGTLEIDDLTGGTFSITNGGVFGSLMSTPLLNPPQSAILGMHKIQQRPVVEDGQVVIRPVMYVALSYDHRIIDGRDAVQFLVSIKESLEDPARLLIGL
jgi:2-oxoglutarate dehydrogenase E2 component (dihydrolipoamide succinyltransferase)